MSHIEHARRDGDPSPLARLLHLPPQSERTLRMEALIARLRLVILAVNIPLLAFFLNTDGWNMQLVWALVAFTATYGAFIAFFRPYRRWRHR